MIMKGFSTKQPSQEKYTNSQTLEKNMIWAETRTGPTAGKEGGALGVTAHPGPRPIWRRGRPALVGQEEAHARCG